MLSSGTASALALFILVTAGLLTIPVALLLVWLYGRAVRRDMMAASRTDVDAPAPSSPTVPPPSGPLPPLLLENIDAGSSGSEAYARARRSLNRAVLVYAIAGVAYALPFAMVWSYLADGAIFAWRREILIAGVYYWPTVVAISLIAATSRTERARIYALLFAGLALFSIYELARSPNLTVGQLLLFWLLTNGPASLLIAALLFRGVRAVASLVLAFLLVIVTGSMLFASAVFSRNQGIAGAVEIGSHIGLGGSGTFYGTYVLGLLLFAVPGWFLLRYFASAHRRKRTSDQSLMLDSVYFIFAFEQSIGLDPRGKFVFTGLVAFLAYKLVKWVGFRLLRIEPAQPAPVLLLLRVFSLDKRSERLFDSLTKWWRRAGSIVMIAGPDLVRSTIQPHELLEFIGGKISREFVADASQLEMRMTSLDLQPDPDGRYRVNQFFCHSDSWQATMRELAAHSSVVLMDLRGLSSKNQGCIYELRQLLSSVDLRRAVFVIDATTDRPFLEATIQQLWREVAPQSPNLQHSHPTVKLYSGSLDTAQGFRQLVQRLLAPAEQPVPAQ